MKYSFLMCLNKGGPFLKQAIASILDQSCGDFDFHIIANDCSDDLWRHLQDYRDPRIKLHRTLIGQLSFNLNFGLNLIGDGYALRMDADDIALPNRLELTKGVLRTLNYPDVLGGAAILIDEFDTETGLYVPPTSNAAIRARLWRSNPLVHPTCAIKVKSALALRGYLGGYMSEDYDLWLRAARDPDFLFGGTSDPLLKYRINPGQSRGNPLAYSEVSGHLLREFLLSGSPKFFAGTAFAIMKRLIRAKRQPTL